MFEAKEMDYNPRRPFYITVGVLVVCAASYGGYVWWQMQPRSLYNAAAIKAAPKAAEANVANAPPGAAAPGGASDGGAPPAGDQAGAPAPAPGAAAQNAPHATGAPAATQVPGAAPPATVAPGRDAMVSSSTRAATAPSPSQAASAPAAQASPSTQPAARAPAPARRASSGDTQDSPREAARAARPAIAVAAPTASVDPQVEQAYDAFQRGDLGVARDQYQRALRQDPLNRDALLGLAAIDIRNRDFELAEARYIRLLETDPRDAHAMAGLIALRGNIDPVQSESRLKSLIAQQPEAAQLHFILGNQFAARSRWPDAQAAYFKAYSLDPENPDYAFNLAVSLDQLRQPRPALEYYRKAVILAATKASGFDKARANARISELTTP
jgi:tetratricopeptide (TPR) repeat protein